MKQLLNNIFVRIIKLYQVMISPFFSPTCRYIPSCSEYGIQAIKKYGLFKGGYQTIKRILRCHPWGGRGHDPVQ